MKLSHLKIVCYLAVYLLSLYGFVILVKGTGAPIWLVRLLGTAYGFGLMLAAKELTNDLDK